MKPQLIRGRNLTHEQRQEVVAWLKSNGCPWLVPYDAHIKITGQYISVETFTIRNLHQSRTLWPKRVPPNWTIPTKTRKYRIRHELRFEPTDGIFSHIPKGTE